ncbi:MAG: hypothetical protein K8J08_19620 [Thermoanaerobaculia bacterium]|nr:hypothetical protein [Thermoanaerobaculia bacterium]
MVPALVLLWTLHGSALASWWTRDDPCLLRSIAEHGIVPHGLDPAVWRALSSNVFMPWQLLSLGFDWHLFGLAPLGYYVHQLLALTLVVVLAHRLFLRWVSPSTSGFALWLFVASAPVFGITQQLMNRHYAEGLALSLASLLLYANTLRSAQNDASVKSSPSRPLIPPTNYASGLLYFAACAAKEVFVPLPLVLASLPRGPAEPGRIQWSQRLRPLLPHGLALLVYLAWRFAMLGGSSFSGYGNRPPSLDPAGFSVALRRLLTGPDWAVALGAGLIALSVVLLWNRRRGVRPLLLVLPVAIVAPWIGIFPHLEARHLLIAALAASLLLATALDELLAGRPVYRRIAIGIVGLVVLGGFLESPVRSRQQASALHYRTEGEWVLRGGPAGLQTTLADGAFLECLVDLDGRSTNATLSETSDTTGGGYCGDPCWCLSLPTASETWVHYDGHGAIVPADPASCAPERVLEAEVTRDPKTSVVSWSLGPWSGDHYSVLLVSPDPSPAVSVPISVPRQGSTPWVGDHSFVFRYESPEGWVGYSSLIDGTSLSTELSTP